MRNGFAMLAWALAAVLSGCAAVERSRNLAEPSVPADVLAAQVCSNCHGLDGNSVSPAFPRLAGQQKQYLIQQLSSFRSQSRKDPSGSQYMWGLSRSLSDAQIAGLAQYFSQQTPARAPRDAEAESRIARGKSIFEQGLAQKNVPACSSCHGPRGQGGGEFPRLAYQHADYIVKQLDVFQGTQGRPGTLMEAVASPLNDQDKSAVAAYLQAFPE